MSLLDMDIDGMIFETFTWNFHHSNLPSSTASLANASPLHPHHDGNDGGGGLAPATVAAGGSGTPTSMAAAAGSSNGGPSAPSASSPFSGATDEDSAVTLLPLKPGGNHLRVTNPNKREYVLLKAHKMLVGTIEAQMTGIIDAFHSLIPRDLVEKYNFTSLEMQLLVSARGTQALHSAAGDGRRMPLSELPTAIRRTREPPNDPPPSQVCGEQRIDVQDLRRSCKYEDGYSGKEDVIAWFWEVAEGLDDNLRRMLLQFWSGSDGMPAEGFGPLDPAFHIVAVERLYDANDTTARLVRACVCVTAHGRSLQGCLPAASLNERPCVFILA